MSEARLEYTIDELIVSCIARQVQNGEVWAQGINTPLVMAGLILAKCTHAPDVRFASAIGQGICQDWGPLRLSRSEDMWLQLGILHLGFATAVAEILPAYQPREFFRPAQVDARGNSNNIALGSDYQRPRLRLPGSGGIPDVSVQYEHTFFYVPRHSPVTFREKIDFVSGMGHSPQRLRGQGPRYMVTNLGQFDWDDGLMRITHLHPGVSLEQVIRKTGFPLVVSPELAVTPSPNAEQLRLMRETIDPLAVRKLETLSGSARRAHLISILDQEARMFS